MDFREIIEFAKDFFGYIVVAFLAIIIVVYVIGFEQIIGPSMNPTLKEDNVVLLDKIGFKILSLKRFDVVVLKQDEKHMVKRIIGLPGEHIKYVGNVLYVNDDVYEEDFLKNVDTADFDLKDIIGNYSVIPDNMYLVLGDNRGNSLDSRSYGLVEKKDIIGKVVVRILPLTGFKLVN